MEAKQRSKHQPFRGSKGVWLLWGFQPLEKSQLKVSNPKYSHHRLPSHGLWNLVPFICLSFSGPFFHAGETGRKGIISSPHTSLSQMQVNQIKSIWGVMMLFIPHSHSLRSFPPSRIERCRRDGVRRINGKDSCLSCPNDLNNFPIPSSYASLFSLPLPLPSITQLANQG